MVTMDNKYVGIIGRVDQATHFLIVETKCVQIIQIEGLIFFSVALTEFVCL